MGSPQQSNLGPCFFNKPARRKRNKTILSSCQRHLWCLYENRREGGGGAKSLGLWVLLIEYSRFVVRSGRGSLHTQPAGGGAGFASPPPAYLSPMGRSQISWRTLQRAAWIRSRAACAGGGGAYCRQLFILHHARTRGLLATRAHGWKSV